MPPDATPASAAGALNGVGAAKRHSHKRHRPGRRQQGRKGHDKP